MEVKTGLCRLIFEKSSCEGEQRNDGEGKRDRGAGRIRDTVDRNDLVETHQ